MNSPIKCAIVGQSLIEHKLPDNISLNEIAEHIKRADFAFTNLELSVTGRRESWPMKPLDWCTRPSDSCLDLLKSLGFNTLSLANNHAWDLGPTGVLDTLEETAKRGFARAGTGASLEEAQAPVFIDTPGGRVALIAMASGNLPDLAFATSRREYGDLARPGVNPLRVRDVYTFDEIGFSKLREAMSGHGFTKQPDGQLVLGDMRFAEGRHGELQRIIDPEDKQRHLDLIREANAQADMVVVYLHQHHWETEWQDVGTWMQDFAHECIEGGAHLFLGHGVPMLQAIEIYRGFPIFYGLGNFIFHPTAGQSYWPDPRCWQSVIMTGEFSNGRWDHINFLPITLGLEQVVQECIPEHASKKWPSFARGGYANSILSSLQNISSAFSGEMEVRADTAHLRLSLDHSQKTTAIERATPERKLTESLS